MTNKPDEPITLPFSITIDGPDAVFGFDQCGRLSFHEQQIILAAMSELPQQIHASLALLEEARKIGLTWVTEVDANGVVDSYLMPISAI